MALIATLVVGANNATTVAGGSIGLSSTPDRERFLALHRAAGAIITGKHSANVEDYSKTDVPIFIFTRDPAPLNFDHPQMQQVAVDRDLAEMARRIDQQIPGDVVIEAGPRLLLALIRAGVVDSLQLSISPIPGDGNFIELDDLLKHFLIESDVEIEGTRLLQCRYNSDATDS